MPTLKARRIRGRHLLVLDLVILVLAFAGSWVAITGLAIPFGAVAIVVVAKGVALARSGTYQSVGTLTQAADFVRMMGWLLLGSTAGYLVAAISGPPLRPEFVVTDTATAALLLALSRVSLGRIGVVRHRSAEPDQSTPAIAPPPELAAMFKEFARAPRTYQPSRFWESLNQRHVGLLLHESGLGNFKRTLNTSYFQFGAAGFLRSIPVLVMSWIRHPDRSVFDARVEGGGWPERSFAIALALYANAVRHVPGGDLLDRLEEPRTGNPIVVHYGGRTISEDLCHSVEEYAAVMSGMPPDLPVRRVVELGAGYGRLAYVFAQARPEIQYHIVDIPPALYVSQRYLTSVLPEREAFRFRPFNRYADVEAEMNRARLVFLEPQQLEELPDGYADIVLTVSTLHEMREDQIAHYLKLVDRICKGAFYTKQWRRFYNDLDEITLARGTYPIPTGWMTLFERSALVPRSFFEALYLCRSGNAPPITKAPPRAAATGPGRARSVGPSQGGL
ncbi:MAG: putative sugar O-methyltransferase [Chloroflexota bacterium]